jgi:hypothetical protein
MTQAAEALPDDPETPKAMLIAERQRAERLVQIIKDLQRHASAAAPRACRTTNCCWRSEPSSRARRRRRLRAKRSRRPDRTLDYVGVDLDPAIIEETREAVPGWIPT